MPGRAFNEPRVVVVGTSGCGKTTFARQLARGLDARHIELDELHWLPDWQIRPAEDFSSRVATAAAAPRWVADGNYSAVRDILWSRATAVVWLDFAAHVVGWRILTRTIRRGLTREEIFSGNRESLAQAFFSRESMLWWAATTFRRNRRTYAAFSASEEWSRLEFTRVRTPAEARALLDAAGYRIEHARRAHVAALPEIELRAGRMFSEQDFPRPLRDTLTPLEKFERAFERGRLWVALDGAGKPVGFAVGSIVDGSAHLLELDVHPDHGRRGLGGRLVDRVADWARSEGHSALTLTTFSHVAWNAPWYRRLGFVELSSSEATPGLLAHLVQEGEEGLDRSKRVAMRLEL